jgi:Dolichyl-phosphate-mannose-protein mannosyltransferase
VTQGLQAVTEPHPGAAADALERPRRLAISWYAVGVTAVTATAGAFLLHQLMAWPPHEDETLALFVGRDSLPGVVEHVTRERGGAPLHFLVAWGVAHLGFGLGGLRLMSAFFAVTSLPFLAALGSRLAGRREALVATALFAGSWLFLFHGIYGRMYSLFLAVSLLATLALIRALERNDRRSWALWILAGLATVAAHPYGVLVLAGHGLYVLSSRRDRFGAAAAAGGALLVLGTPFWLTDLVLAGRFDVGVGGGGAKLGGPLAVADYLWSAAGDATAGWRPVLFIVLALAALGLVALPRDGRRLVMCVITAPVAAFLLARLGGAAAPESRHLIFAAPFLSLAVAAGLVRITRRLPAILPLLVVGLIVAEVTWAWHRTAPLFEWEPDKRQATRAEAETWLADTSSPDDVLFGYEPLYLGAWERNPAFPKLVVPRADSTLALRVLEQRVPLGRGVWVLDASERNNVKPRLEIDPVSPTPAAAFDVRAFGPFLVIRTRQTTLTPEAYLYDAGRAMLVGRSLGIGDADINLQTIERAARTLRGYGPSLRSFSSNSR